MLLLLGPFVAAGLILVGGMLFTDVGSLPSSLHGWIAGIPWVYALILLSQLFKLWNACIAGSVLLASLAYRRFAEVQRACQPRSIFVLTAAGAVIGALFAAIIVTAYKTTYFVDFISIGEILPTRHFEPFDLPMVFVTGVVDGALVAFFATGETSYAPTELSENPQSGR